MSVTMLTPSESIHLETLNSLSRLDDGVSVTVTEAALFLRRSERTLAQMRREGTGPEYQQPMGAASTARNQRVTYLMGDLRRWQRENTLSSSMDAAVRRGLTFASLADLQRPEPFWLRHLDGETGIIGHALTIDPREYEQLLKDEQTEVLWVSLDEALQERWQDIEQRARFDDAFADVLNALLARNSAQWQEDRLGAIARANTTVPRNPSRKDPV